MPHASPQPPRESPSRRALITAAAWAVPAVIVTTETPALAVSGGSVPVAKIRPSSDFAAEDRRQYDPATNTTRGPLAVYVRARYDQNIVWWPTRDPDVATIPYVVLVDGPLGSSSFSGTVTIALGGYVQDERVYPADGSHPIPVGTYTFTLVLFGSDGSTSSSTSIVVT